MLVFETRYSKSVKTSSRYVRKRSFKNFNPAAFFDALQQLGWLDLYLCNDANTAVELLTSKLKFILDTLAPMKTIQIRTRYAPLLSKVTLELMKERDKQQKLAAETKKREDWQRYKALRNRINNRLKFEETKWQKSKLEECGEDAGKIWKNVKGILNWKSSGSPNQLFHKSRLISKPQEIAEAQNQFSLDKIDLIRENLPPPTTDPLKTLKALMQGRCCILSCNNSYQKSFNIHQGLSYYLEEVQNCPTS